VNFAVWSLHQRSNNSLYLGCSNLHEGLNSFSSRYFELATSSFFSISSTHNFYQLLGCYSFVNQSTCTASGGTFRSLAMTKGDCIDDEGCSSNLQLRTLFSMTPSQCKKCNRIRGSFYDWSDGYAVSGEPISLQWIDRSTEGSFIFLSIDSICDHPYSSDFEL